jgi:hypothetical protein
MSEELLCGLYSAVVSLAYSHVWYQVIFNKFPGKYMTSSAITTCYISIIKRQTCAFARHIGTQGKYRYV